MADKDCICNDCKINLSKKFDDLYNSFNKENQEIICELIYIHDLRRGALFADINSKIVELDRKGCVKVNISFAGKTFEGKKIKLKDDVKINIE
ncbi:hypothetical protein UFOVP51_86 [uncultured Caudovirales phage]|uniref:Uncharacterized protein n=1 Tax=uncultured Caudovirales phage TaxID=2100421 RepID=A0A6J5T9E4_9CAUD|nr:hypothetical protein UFOVP51_86 [uncultured Caudovirales phage]CAB4240785.1 hypothetical protein UFOVP34_20 [uncultured Caudovirales phage]